MLNNVKLSYPVPEQHVFIRKNQYKNLPTNNPVNRLLIGKSPKIGHFVSTLQRAINTIRRRPGMTYYFAGKRIIYTQYRYLQHIGFGAPIQVKGCIFLVYPFQMSSQ